MNHAFLPRERRRMVYAGRQARRVTARACALYAATRREAPMPHRPRPNWTCHLIGFLVPLLLVALGLTILSLPLPALLF
jgi:hypothetical protein